MSTKYRYEFTPDAFKQNFRNLLEDLEALSASIVSTLAQAVLLAGRSGGQAIISGTLNDQRLGIGAAPGFSLDVQVTQNTMTIIRSMNVSTGTSAEARLRAQVDVARAELTSTGSGYTAFAYFGLTPASWSFCAAAAGNGLGVGTLNSSPLLFGTNNIERMRILSTGTILTYQHLATAAAFSKNNATLANVTGLSFNVDAGRTYLFRAELPFTADAVGGHKYAISGTCTATSIYYQVTSISNPTNALVITNRQTALAGAIGQGGATSGHTTIFGRIVVNAAGTLTVQFAQNAAVNTSQLEAGASFQIYPV